MRTHDRRVATRTIRQCDQTRPHASNSAHAAQHHDRAVRAGSSRRRGASIIPPRVRESPRSWSRCSNRDSRRSALRCGARKPDDPVDEPRDVAPTPRIVSERPRTQQARDTRRRDERRKAKRANLTVAKLHGGYLASDTGAAQQPLSLFGMLMMHMGVYKRSHARSRAWDGRHLRRRRGRAGGHTRIDLAEAHWGTVSAVEAGGYARSVQ